MRIQGSICIFYSAFSQLSNRSVGTPTGNIGRVVKPVGKSFNMALNQQGIETDR